MTKKELNKLRPIWFDLKLRYEDGEQLTNKELDDLNTLNRLFLEKHEIEKPKEIKHRHYHEHRKANRYVMSNLIEVTFKDGSKKEFDNILQASRLLGITEQAIYNKLQDGKALTKGKCAGCTFKRLPNPRFPKPLADLGFSKISWYNIEDFEKNGMVEVHKKINGVCRYFRVFKNKCIEISFSDFRLN